MSHRQSTSILVAVLAVLLGQLAIETKFSATTLAAFARADAGATAALPVEVLDAQRAIASLALREVMFAGRFSPHVDMQLHQRLVEYIYPVRVVPGGAYYVLIAGDEMPISTCEVAAQQGQVQVVRCG